MVLVSVAPEKRNNMVVKEGLDAANVDINGGSTTSKAIFIVNHQP
jgi:hypothetical protein